MSISLGQYPCWSLRRSDIHEIFSSISPNIKDSPSSTLKIRRIPVRQCQASWDAFPNFLDLELWRSRALLRHQGKLTERNFIVGLNQINTSPPVQRLYTNKGITVRLAMAAHKTIPRFLLPQTSWSHPLPRQLPKSPLRIDLLPPHRSFSIKSSKPLYAATPFSLISRKHSPFNTRRATFLPNPYAKAFSTSTAHYRDHHFDTLKFVQRLRDEGFSEEQSEAMMLVLSDVIEESIQNLTRTMVLKEGMPSTSPEQSFQPSAPHNPQFQSRSPTSIYPCTMTSLHLLIITTDADRSTYTQKVDFTKLRSELLALDSSDSSMTQASHERLSNDLAKLTSRLRDEIGRAQASVRLDLNLEKGRIREEAKGQELRIKETETRIEQEVAGLRERVEGVKFGTLQWLM